MSSSLTRMTAFWSTRRSAGVAKNVSRGPGLAVPLRFGESPTARRAPCEGSGDRLLSEPTAGSQPWRREPLFVPDRRHRASARRERIAAIWLSTRRPPFDNAESRVTTYKRHVVGHYRLGESLQGERANLFGCDTSF